MLLKPEQLFLVDSFAMVQEVLRGVDNWLSAIFLHHFTTNRAQTLMLVWKAKYKMVGKTPAS